MTTSLQRHLLLVCPVFHTWRKVVPQPRNPPGENTPALGQQAPNLIDQGSALLTESAAQAMDRVEILALHGLEWDEVHAGAKHRFTTRLRITALSLIAFARGLDDLGAHELDGVPHLWKLPRPLVGTRTRLSPT